MAELIGVAAESFQRSQQPGPLQDVAKLRNLHQLGPLEANMPGPLNNVTASVFVGVDGAGNHDEGCADVYGVVRSLRPVGALLRGDWPSTL